MNTYLVTIPVAGHLTFEVNAMSPEDAKAKAEHMDANEGELSFETLDKFHEGNVCYCPTPWEIEVEQI